MGNGFLILTGCLIGLSILAVWAASTNTLIGSGVNGPIEILGSKSVTEEAANIGNPSAIYCTELGYTYAITEGDRGQSGVCGFPDGTVCEAWDFLQGKCGQQNNYCALQGYNTEVRTDGRDPFSREYGVCVLPDGTEVGTIVHLSGLGDKPVPAGCASTGSSPGWMPEGELSESRLGMQPEVPSDLPASFDWRDHLDENWLTPIKDQGYCGSCWAFAPVAAAEAAHKIGYDNPDLELDLSEQYLVSDCNLAAGNCCG